MTEIKIPRSLPQRGWPYRKRPAGLEWTGPSGARTIGDGRFGMPLPKDRAIVLDLATSAHEQGSIIRRRPAAVAERFGLPWSDKQVIEAVHRVGYSWYEAPARQGCCSDDCQAVAPRIPVATRIAQCARSGELVVGLSEPFVAEALAGASGKAEVVGDLTRKNQIGALDLYMVIAVRSDADEHARIPIFENGHIFGMLTTLSHSRCTTKPRRHMSRRTRLRRRKWRSRRAGATVNVSGNPRAIV